MIRAVFWDFGGVILASPFDAFNEYEHAKGLPVDFIRGVNARDPRHQRVGPLRAPRGDGVRVRRRCSPTNRSRSATVSPGADVIAMLSGAVRPEMVRALDGVIAAGYVTACLTNNVESDESATRRSTR